MTYRAVWRSPPALLQAQGRRLVIDSSRCILSADRAGKGHAAMVKDKIEPDVNDHIPGTGGRQGCMLGLAVFNSACAYHLNMLH